MSYLLAQLFSFHCGHCPIFEGRTRIEIGKKDNFVNHFVLIVLSLKARHSFEMFFALVTSICVRSLKTWNSNFSVMTHRTNFLCF